MSRPLKLKVTGAVLTSAFQLPDLGFQGQFAGAHRRRFPPDPFEEMRMLSLLRDEDLSPAKEQGTSFRKVPCVRTGIPFHLGSFQQRIAHNPNATGMLADGSGWYRAIQVIRIRNPVPREQRTPPYQPSQCIERTLHGRLSRIRRKDHQQLHHL